MTMSIISEVTLRPNSVLKSGANRLAIAVLLLLHMGATCVFLPPWEVLQREPLHYSDHPIMTHRVHLYRQGLQESGLPWGYDPAVSAGAFMSPGQDLGAKPQQVLSVILPFLSPGTVIRLFCFVAVLTFPLWMFLACRRLGIPEDMQSWVMLTLIGPVWLPILSGRFASYIVWGLVSFAAASYFSVYVLALFLDFLSKPGCRIYVAFCLSSALLWLLHIVGPIPIILPLVLYTLVASSLTWRWRLALLLAPLGVVICNAFWVFPYMATSNLAWPPWPVIPALVRGNTHLTDDNWSELLSRLLSGGTAPFDPIWVGLEVIGLGLTVYGFVIWRTFSDRRMVLSFALAAAFTCFLTYFGSFLPVTVIMQPTRFFLPLYILLSLPAGIALASLAQKLRLPVGLSAAGLALLLAVAAILHNRLQRLPLPPSPDLLGHFVARHTDSTDRLLIQSPHGYGSNHYESKIFPLVFGREVIGCDYPMVYDPAQFLGPTLWGRELHTWSPDELRLTLDRWGVAWVFTVTPEAQTLLAATTNQPGEVVGKYHAFRVPGSHTRFLVGKGHVVATVNRFELTQLRPENGLIVLRYRYHPAWETQANVHIEQYPVPEDPIGFIALRGPPESITLTFNPWKMLRTSWP